MKGFQQKLQPSWVKCCVLLTLFACLGATAHAATYYVTTSGNNGWTGTSEGTAWRTITYAATRAQAGDTVNIKAGNYGNEHVVVSYSGSSGNPITFQGYGGTVRLGTLPSPRTTPASNEIGFKMVSKNYITLRNLNFTWYYECVWVESSDHVTLDNIYIDKCGADGAKGDGIYIYYSDYASITDCTVIDCGGNNVFLNHSNHCTIDNLTTLGTLIASNTYCTDYYCVLRCSSYNTIQNSYAEDTYPSGKGNHGFIIKDASYTPNSTGNVFQDCTAKSFDEAFSVAHLAYGNTFLRCHADNSAKPTTQNLALVARNGAHDNTFRECTAIGKRAIVGLNNLAEGNEVNKDGNKWINCILRGINSTNSYAVYFDKSSNTEFENCVFDNCVYFARYTNTNTGNSFKNCIITGMTYRYDSQNLAYPWGGMAGYDGTSALSVTYTDFFDNGFSAFSGTGNITDDPKFADQANGDYHLKSTGGRWNGSTWVQDTEDSPCIDAGDPASDYSNEPEDNGDRINIGGYGNTAEASMSSAGGTLPANMDNRLREADPTGVYGTNTFLDVGYNSSNSTRYRDVTWFDMTAYMDDDPNTITDAKLSMYWYYPSSTRAADTVVDIYKAENGWDHGYVCWNNKANGTAWTYAGGDWTDSTGASQGTSAFASITFPAGTVATNQYYDWTVTDLVKSIITAGVNPGMLIKARTEATGNYIAFYAAGNASNRPELSITRLASQTEGTAAYDNRLKSSTPTTVLGTSTFNDVGTLSGVSYRDLIWFDLSPFTDVETITKATLSLYWYYPSSTRTNNTVVDIYRPAAGWDPAYVCWTNKASGTAWANAGGDWYDANGTAQGSTPFASYTFPAGTVATNQYYEFDVTALVNYYRTNGGNAGFFIKARTEGDNYIAFYSLNNASYKPKLEITTTISQ